MNHAFTRIIINNFSAMDTEFINLQGTKWAQERALIQKQQSINNILGHRVH